MFGEITHVIDVNAECGPGKNRVWIGGPLRYDMAYSINIKRVARGYEETRKRMAVLWVGGDELYRIDERGNDQQG